MKQLIFVMTGLLLAFSITSHGQNSKKFAADSEIYLFDLTIEKGQYQLTNGRNISNNDDYDNQPYFMTTNDSVLFTSSRDGLQTDIYQFNIKSNQLTQLTETEHSEFSPKPVGKTGNISFVSEGFNPYQSVWQLNRKTNEQSWLLNSKEPVGYYHYDATTSNVLFWSRYGWSVQYLNLEKNINRFVSGHALPSSPQQIPKSDRFSFVHRQTNGMVWIKAFDPNEFAITPIAPIFDDNYEYAWAPNGDILRFNNGKLMVWSSSKTAGRWVEQQNVNQLISGSLGRLSVSSDGKYIAIVTTQ
ncbi:TolB-like translocation protein [Thalassotalea eurytherma]|uniref:WD40 repeat domain-containing protein n=1 Tax=Thalassotalea eurytherma TaxID=1144278 RepID=A0ABQ6H1T6_9GAMM|nr:hypothetical protein [Thalassotalea eurytherma]GLX82168.1 hypothetical protein theurythT_16200 [Thalassotalea eurytherma]